MKDVVKTMILRRKKSSVIIHEMKVKNMFLDIKNEKAKVMKKVNNIMHSELQIKKMK